MKASRLVVGAVVVAGSLLGAAGPAAAAWLVGAVSVEAFASGSTVEPPVLPTTSVTGSSVTLGWSAPASGAAPSGYTVERTAPTAATVCVAVAATTCTDNGLAPSTTYTYTVTALRGVWASGPLGASATTATPLPSAFLVTVPATVTAGTSFAVTVQARKSDGTNDTTYTGTHALTFSGPGTVDGNAPVYPASAVFDAGGLATVTVRLYKAETVTLTVADGDPTRTGVSGAVIVVPQAAAKLRWTTDAAGLIDACPSGSVVVGPGGQRSWYVAVLDQYGNRAVQGAGARTITISRMGGGGPGVGNQPTVNPLTVPAGANPAVTSGTTTMKLKKKSALDTTYKAADNPLSITCTLKVV